MIIGSITGVDLNLPLPTNMLRQGKLSYVEICRRGFQIEGGIFGPALASMQRTFKRSRSTQSLRVWTAGTRNGI